MKYFWVHLANGKRGCIGAPNASDATAIAESATGSKVGRIWTLPYPAKPQLNETECPPFCYSPEKCKGNTACPQHYACSE